VEYAAFLKQFQRMMSDLEVENKFIQLREAKTVIKEEKPVKRSLSS
jgi:hypothetical protein